MSQDAGHPSHAPPTVATSSSNSLTTTSVRPSPLISPDAADASNVVFFPHRRFIDFIIHYADTDFHVHQPVLYQHSAYFRAYFDTFASAADSDSPTAKKSKGCHHPTIAHCIHLPLQTRLVGQTAVTAVDFDYFLRHLYFSSHYCYPPLLPKTDIDLDADFPPLSQTFPPITSLDWCSELTPLRLTDGDDNAGVEIILNEALLTLAHYLDCAAMMRQCEAVILTDVEYGSVTDCLLWLPLCEQYHLEKAKQAVIDIVAADNELLEKKEFKEAKQKLDKGLVIEILERALRSRSEQAQAVS